MSEKIVFANDRCLIMADKSKLFISCGEIIDVILVTKSTTNAKKNIR